MSRCIAPRVRRTRGSRPGEPLAGVEQFGVPRYEPAKVRRRWRDLIEYHDRSVVPDAPLSVLRRQDLWNGPDGDLTTSII